MKFTAASVRTASSAEFHAFLPVRVKCARILPGDSTRLTDTSRNGKSSSERSTTRLVSHSCHAVGRSWKWRNAFARVQKREAANVGEHPLSRPPLETGSRHHAKAKTTLNMQSLAFSFRRGKTSSIRGAFFIGLTFQGEHTVFLMAAFQPLHFFLDTKKNRFSAVLAV